MFNMKKENFKHIDFFLIAIMSSLVGIGLLAITSATLYSGNSGVVTKQLIFFLIGFVLMLIVMSIDYHFLGEWYIAIYIVTIIALVAVFFLGKEAKGATRWIDFGFFQIQPSEFAKISMILCTAKLLDIYNHKINRFSSIFIVGVFQLIPFILIYLQPNLSTSLVIITLLVVQLFASELKLKNIVVAALIGLVITGSGLFYIIQNPNQGLIQDYQRKRIMTMIEGGDALGSDFQTNRSVHAIGSGGLEGKGLYKGAISQLNYLPESHNDFIMATLAEEFGFIGVLVIITLILLLIGRALWIAHHASDDFGRFIIVGYVGMIAMQSFVNMGVVTDLLPNTGLPIPFISYGGSSLWANMIGMGLVLNVGMRRKTTMF